MINSQINDDIECLLKVAQFEIEIADKSGNSKLFYDLGEKYGPIAFRVFKYLDLPSKSCDTLNEYYRKSKNAVLLDPSTVCNRIKELDNAYEDINPYCPEFWNHCDVIKSLIDFINLSQKELINV